MEVRRLRVGESPTKWRICNQASGGNMIEISIGGMPRAINSANESWINEQINKRREADEPVCVRVTVKTDDADLVFSSPGCKTSGRAVSRELSRTENQIRELWQKRGLNTNDFTGGSVVAFLKQLERIL